MPRGPEGATGVQQWRHFIPVRIYTIVRSHKTQLSDVPRFVGNHRTLYHTVTRIILNFCRDDCAPASRYAIKTYLTHCLPKCSNHLKNVETRQVSDIFNDRCFNGQAHLNIDFSMNMIRKNIIKKIHGFEWIGQME